MSHILQERIEILMNIYIINKNMFMSNNTDVILMVAAISAINVAFIRNLLSSKHQTISIFPLSNEIFLNKIIIIIYYL